MSYMSKGKSIQCLKRKSAYKLVINCNHLNLIRIIDKVTILNTSNIQMYFEIQNRRYMVSKVSSKSMKWILRSCGYTRVTGGQIERRIKWNETFLTVYHNILVNIGSIKHYRFCHSACLYYISYVNHFN